MANYRDSLWIENLYNRTTGDEDARVCKDIPDSACSDQPYNFFAYLVANLLGKVSDEIASAKLIIPWLFGVLGVPAFFAGFLVPIRESGVLLPQLVVAAAVRKLAIRKYIWVLGAVLSAISLFGMAWVTLFLDGNLAGWGILIMLIIFSLARGLCSVSAKDVLGKTVSKSRRGILMGWSASLSGFAVLAIGLWLGMVSDGASLNVFAGLLLIGGVLWIVAALIFATILEQPGATEGGGNAIKVALQQMTLLYSDSEFRTFVIVRGLLLSVALAPPFYVILAQNQSSGGLLGLGALIIANGFAGSISSPFWGYMSDKSSKTVMQVAVLGSGLLGIFTFIAVTLNWSWVLNPLGFAILFMILTVMHGGVRLGRKVYLVDMATAETRAAYVAVSNTVIGILMLFGGLVGLLGDYFGPAATILVLSVVAIIAALGIRRLPEVS